MAQSSPVGLRRSAAALGSDLAELSKLPLLQGGQKGSVSMSDPTCSLVALHTCLD